MLNVSMEKGTNNSEPENHTESAGPYQYTLMTRAQVKTEAMDPETPPIPHCFGATARHPKRGSNTCLSDHLKLSTWDVEKGSIRLYVSGMMCR